MPARLLLILFMVVACSGCTARQIVGGTVDLVADTILCSFGGGDDSKGQIGHKDSVFPEHDCWGGVAEPDR